MLSLNACATAPTGWFSPDDLYPTAIVACKDLPIVPDRPAPGVARPPEVQAGYVADLHDTAVDCKDTVGATADRKEAYARRYEQHNYNLAQRWWRRATDSATTTED